MSNSFPIKSCLVLLMLSCSILQSAGARAETIELHEFIEEVRGGLFLKEAFNRALEPEQFQRILELYDYSPPGWVLESEPPRFERVETFFKFIVTPEESNAQSTQNSGSMGVDSTPTAGLPPTAVPEQSVSSSSVQGWWGYWDKAKEAVAGATSLALSAAKAVGGYAKQAFAVRTIAGSVTNELTYCPAPYVPMGMKFNVNLSGSDALVYSLIKQFSFDLCYDDQNWQKDKKINVHLKIQVDPGLAYSSLVDPEIAAMKSEVYARAWLRAFQEVVQEHEFKIVRDRWEDLAAGVLSLQ